MRSLVRLTEDSERVWSDMLSDPVVVVLLRHLNSLSRLYHTTTPKTSTRMTAPPAAPAISARNRGATLAETCIYTL